MELIYIWLKEYKNNVLKQEGLSLNEKYLIDVEEYDNNLQFTVTENSNIYNIFSNNIIKNVTAIVGNNGSGKTSLLESIYYSNGFGRRKNNNPEYKKAIDNQNERNSCVKFYLKNNNIIVFHNLEKNPIINCEKQIDIINMNDDGMYKKHFMKEGLLNQITTCFITNSSLSSMNGSSSLTKEEILSSIYITPDSMKHMAIEFNKKNIKFLKENNNSNLYSHCLLINDLICRSIPERNFNNICDLLCYSQFSNRGSLERFLGGVPNKITVWCRTLFSILKDNDYIVDDSLIKLLNEKHIEWMKRIDTNQWSLSEIVICMRLNLLYELDLICNYFSDDKILFDIDEELINIKQRLSYIIEDINILNYYMTAFDELEDFENIIVKFRTEDNLLPLTDMGYKSRKVVYKSQNKCLYIEFMKFIESLSHRKYSFILKYLLIEDLPLSSGERAFLNIFKSLNLISFYNELISNKEVSTRENILLLVDEIDLYFHPEWQVNLLKYFLEELKIQFPKNQIQIIFTTHSPILLSDVPLSNTIYIKKENDISKILEKDELKPTFAANIYSLFNDSFFLRGKGVTGEYSRNVINLVYTKLRKNLYDEVEKDKKEIRYILDSIGEPLIKNKLEKMYQDVYKDNTDLLDITRQVENYINKNHFQSEVNYKKVREIERILNSMK